ncbi:hypothetical protein B6S08_00980 [Oceanimonas doudoroffii]|uniref:Uncharacterized protein n=1 Tax=Oceanimonas doudoroffii TaxID=84158 RepID=A0A233RFI2_9GAMM|nr:hypothetical protein B6S08_00980 [Oceanimonas doudoroffii]
MGVTKKRGVRTVFVMPVKTGIQNMVHWPELSGLSAEPHWTPAFAGATRESAGMTFLRRGDVFNYAPVAFSHSAPIGAG